MKFLRIPLLCTLFMSAAPAQTTGSLPVLGAEMHYRIYGDGAPLLITGGFAGLANDYLEPVAHELGKRYRVILADLRGTGRSPVFRHDTSTVSPKLAVDDLEALRRHLNIPAWTVVGHAWGGTVALIYTALHPEVVRSLLLIGPNGVDLRFFEYYNVNVMSRLRAEDSAAFKASEQYLTTDRGRALFMQFQATLPGYFADRKHLPAIRQFIVPERYSATTANAYWSGFIALGFSVPAALEQFSRPVLIVQGEQDPIDRRTAERLQEALPHAHVEWIRRCGAFPWIEQPAPFWKSVKGFLEKSAAEGK